MNSCKNIKKELTLLDDFYQKNRNLKVILLYGEKSFEDRFYIKNLPFESISSGHIYHELNKLGFNVRIVKNTESNLERKLNNCDVVFINMHGEFGEDGCIQGLLSYFGKKFTGSGIFANALSIDKVRFKNFLKTIDVSTPKFFSVSKTENKSRLLYLAEKLNMPVVFKLRGGGSSLGMEKVENKKILLKKKDVLLKGGDYFVEEFKIGRDLTVSIIDLPTKTVVLPILEVITHNRLYDYDLKIKSQKGEHVVEYSFPTDFSLDTINLIKDTCLDIYKKAECSGFARIDLILDNNGKIYFLELNSIPGLQKGSNFLLCANKAGLSDAQVFLSLLNNAIRKEKNDVL